MHRLLTTTRKFLRSSHSPTSADRARSGGATLVEAAVVFPVLILVVIGTMEIGLAFKDFLTVSALSREGARVAALAGTDSQADCAVLRGVSTVATQGDIERITDVQIYKAAEGTGAQGATNTWTYNPGKDPVVCTVPSGIDDGWSPGAIAYPPSVRQTTVGSTPLDIVGVRVTLTRSWVTGFPPFRGTFTIDETTLTRLEPAAFE